ncbi:hypothetical protein COO72_12300 [Bifidobacterium callitrichos]|nr:hypothetical protein COO72_12300 [Bifidobacterium callitrichos]
MPLTLTATTAADLINKAGSEFTDPPSIFQIIRPGDNGHIAFLEYDDPATAGETDAIARKLHITDPQQIDELRRALQVYDEDNDAAEAVRRLTRMGLTVNLHMIAYLTIIPDTPPAGDDDHTH